MDPYDVVDEEVSKIDVEKMFKAYYKQFYEDNIDPNKSIYKNAQKPEALETSRELLEEIRAEISDLIYTVLSEFCHNFAQDKHKSILWMRGDTPDILLRKAGAIDVHYSAKEELNRVVQAIAMEIAKKAVELSYANSIEKGVVWDHHIIEAIKTLGQKSLRDILINYCKEIEGALERHKKHERSFPEVEMKEITETLEYEIERMRKWFE